MRFGLKALLLIMALIAIAATWYAYSRRPRPHTYWGHLVRGDTVSFLRQIDPEVKVDGGGGGGGDGAGQVYWKTYQLTLNQPLDERLIETLRDRHLEDLRAQGVRVFMVRDLPVPASKDMESRGFLKSWGFEILVEDQGCKGLISIRLVSRPSAGAETPGHKAELYENIVVFQKE